MKVAPIGNHESAGFADGCCTVETVTFFAGSGG
jgi:hypothetical protein